ncbi:MAG: hypothetical protein RL681_200 [Candidatus Parcubacteria bacterium]|jgi:UDPglucose 6-dehydrogenase
MKQKVGIVGVGYVGGALRNWFEKNKEHYELFLYDTGKKLGSLREVNQADTVFVSVPTPFHMEAVSGKSGYDDSAVVESLERIKDGKTVVIKSTIVPTSTERFQERFPEKTILFNPEFLRAKTANEDFLHPDRQIVGYANEAGKRAAGDVLRMLPEAPYARIMRAREAEMIKYFNNNFLATRVVFANQMYDICSALGIDYAAVKDGAAQDARIGGSHFDVLHDGYRGYGGACLPKDVRALLAFAKQADVDVRFLETLEQVNEDLRKAIRES